MFGSKFFIQAGLFEKTGYADWKLIHYGKKTYAYRISSEMGSGLINNIAVIFPFDTNFEKGDMFYSYTSCFNHVLKNISEVKHFDIKKYNVKDRRALPQVIEKEIF